MAERIAELSTFMNRSGRRGCDMAGNASGKGELLEQLFETRFVLRDIGVNFTPGAFQIDVAHDCRTAMSGTGDIEHVEIIFLDDPVEMHIDEVPVSYTHLTLPTIYSV